MFNLNPIFKFMTDNEAHSGYKQPGVSPFILKQKKLSVQDTAILWAVQVAMVRLRD